jgi:hypothetical protein
MEEVVFRPVTRCPGIFGILLVHESVSLSLGPLERRSLAGVPRTPRNFVCAARGSLSRRAEPGLATNVRDLFICRAQPAHVPAWARTFLPGWP